MKPISPRRSYSRLTIPPAIRPALRQTPLSFSTLLAWNQIPFSILDAKQRLWMSLQSKWSEGARNSLAFKPMKAVRFLFIVTMNKLIAFDCFQLLFHLWCLEFLFSVYRLFAENAWTFFRGSDLFSASFIPTLTSFYFLIIVNCSLFVLILFVSGLAVFTIPLKFRAFVYGDCFSQWCWFAYFFV